MKTFQKKVCLLGEFAVGKTSLVRQFVEGRFDDRYLSTIGVKISRRVISRPHHTVNLLVWDLAGGDDFGLVPSGYLRGAAGAILVCDLTRPVTLLALNGYVAQLRALGRDIPLVLAANKVDLMAEREIGDDDLAAASDHWGAQLLLTSAKTAVGVADAFETLANQMMSDQEPEF